MYTLSRLAEEGHVYGERGQLVKKAAELLEAEEGPIVMTMDQMFADKELVLETRIVFDETVGDEVRTDALYLPPFYFAEIGVANRLLRLAKAPGGDRLWSGLWKARLETGNKELSVDVSHIESLVHQTYDEAQAEAIRLAACSKIMILTGGPGTGKTTVTKGIIAAFRARGW